MLLRDLVDEVFDDTAAMGIAAVNQVADDLVIHADRTQLYRSLFNLVRNAVEAMTPALNANGAADDSDDRIGAVTVSAEETEAGLSIIVSDTGPGIPDHARGELFEPFKGSQKPGGSGLGVAIAAEIIRAHGGEIHLAASDAEGTRFEISLPGATVD